jgi:hypothetical protein
LHLHITLQLAYKRKQQSIDKDRGLAQARLQQLQALQQDLVQQVPQMRAGAKQQQDAIRTIWHKQGRYKQQQQKLSEVLRENFFEHSVNR